MNRQSLWIAIVILAVLGISVYFAWSGEDESLRRTVGAAGPDARDADSAETITLLEGIPATSPDRGPSEGRVDALVASILSSSSPETAAPDGMDLVESSDVLLARLIPALPSLRRIAGTKVTSNGRREPLVRELRVEGGLGDWMFAEKLMNLRHTVILTGRRLQMEFVWLRKADADVIPWVTYVIIGFRKGPLAGKKWLTVMYINGGKLEVSRRVWNGDSFGTPPGAVVGSFSKDGGFLRDAFVKNMPDASFKSFVNW